MVSGFQSRACGLGLGHLLSPKVLEEINKTRKNKNYCPSEGASILYNTDNKKEITDDPLYIYFNTGASKDGYWTSSHAKIQLGDAIDCLKVIFPECDYLFGIANHQAIQKFV